MNIEITGNAVAKIKSYAEKDADKNKGLRIYVEGGGCSGFQYGFKFDLGQDTDHKIELADHTQVFVDPISASYIEGSTIDYVESLMNSGFVVQNPKAKATCGCGMSFNV